MEWHLVTSTLVLKMLVVAGLCALPRHISDDHPSEVELLCKRCAVRPITLFTYLVHLEKVSPEEE